MSTPHHSGDHHGNHPAPETDHTHHPDHASHEHHADADTHGQAMPHGHPHSALDEDHHVHSHGEHAGHSTAMFRERFWWSLILSIPVVIFSPMVAHLLGYPLPAFPGSTWVPPVLDTIIFVYGGTPFLKGGWTELKSRQPGMMLLIAMAITVAFVASWVTTLGLGGFDLDFWWELALLVTIMLLGHWLEMRALGGASSALDALAALLPDEAEKVIDGTTRTVATSELVVDDVVLVRAGARVPADGTIIDGAAEFDEAMITGESRPVFRDTGDKVVAGTVATDNTVRVRVEATGGDTALAGIQRMVADAQESSSRAQALADRAAAALFWFALISALITAVVWTIIGSPDDAVVRTVTVLVIACPHALGLAIPLVIAISTERAAKSGVLIKDRMALERMRTIDVVLFDKTGTLTEGAHTVTGVAAAVGVTEGELLALAAAAEADSEHPVARAIVAAAAAHPEASRRQIRATGFSAASGRGVRATVDGAEILVGGPGLGAPHWGMRVATPTPLVDNTPLTPIPPRGTITSMSNEHGYHGNTENHLARLRRIEGQVRGLQRMISQGEYCIDILTQVSAVQSALDSVAVNLLKDHMNHCVVTAAHESDEAAQAKVDEAAAAIARLIKS